MSSCEIRFVDVVKVMMQLSEDEGKPLKSSSKICPKACRKGWGRRNNVSLPHHYSIFQHICGRIKKKIKFSTYIKGNSEWSSHI
jgi:hypothetical protein